MSTQTIEKPAANAVRKEQYITPAVNLRETKDAWILEAEMPGVNRNGIEVTVQNNELNLVGRRCEETPGGIVYRESRLADYRRTFDLDPAIDAAKIVAKVDQGVLTLTLPKSESVKPRKIEIAA